MTQKQTSQLSHDLERLRSSSPAIKRPASDMGAQDREEHTADVDMDRDSSPFVGPGQNEAQDSESGATPKAKQLDTGSRHMRLPSGEVMSDGSDPRAASQTLPSEADSASLKSSLLPQSDASTAPTSVSTTSWSAEDLPSIDEQVEKVRAMATQELQDNQKGYLVSTKWLNRVIAKSSVSVEGAKIDKSAEEEEIGPVDNSDLIMVMEGSGELKDEAGEPFIAIRPNVTLADDFQVLPEEAWDLIVRWYSVAPNSPIITRYAHNTAEYGHCQWELNPPIFTFLKVPGAHTAQTQKDANTQPPRLLASRQTSTNKWLADAKKLMSIDMAQKVRVWKYLGGLKGNASGILTPAASRSASPAPGAEVIATAGDKMLLDVVAFAALSEGDERELLDIKDNTNDPKYNGKSTLQTIGLGKNDVIILEEQTGSAGDGEWASESAKARVGGKRGLAPSTGKPATASGRASPAPGIMTRGRQRRDGRPKGITGLNNIGNTCYMNSALQCIRSVEELTTYFLNDYFRRDLNPSNPLSHNGEVAKAYGLLLKKMYDENVSSFSPNGFKTVIGRYGPNFSGYGQQDSQEFLLFLLDGLAEDLSRIQKKPYIEKPDSTDEMVHDHAALKAFADKNWEIYKARNDSVVTDLFSGMYKSTVTCPICEKVSIIFDPFNSLTLQLPIENNWQREVRYFPFQGRPILINVDIDKNATTSQLKEFVAARVKVDPKFLVAAEPYRNRFYKIFDDNMLISDFNLQQHDELGVWEVDVVPTNYNSKKPKRHSNVISYGWNRGSDENAPDIDSEMADRLLVPVFHRIAKQTGRVPKPFFGYASFVVLDRKDQKDYDRILQKVLGNVSTMTTMPIFNDENEVSTSAPTPEDSDVVITTDDGHSSDSNNIQAQSVEGEDGLVDVSMRDEDNRHVEENSIVRPSRHTVLQPGVSLPRRLQNADKSSTMFDIRVAHANHAVPTGWNGVDDHKDYTSVLDRRPKIVTHHSARRTSLTHDGAASDAASSDDAEDIPHDAPAEVEENADDEGLPDVADMFGAFTNSTKRKHQTYSSKDRRKTLDESNSLESHSLVRPGEAIILDWNADAYDSFFEGEKDDEMKGAPTWENMEKYEDPELKAKQDKRQTRKKNGISLDDCLNETGKSETLSENNAWYCPKCKEHRRAEKKLELWKIPDILIMHLKRFSSNRSFRDKLEILVDYPVEGLDMTSRVIEPESGKGMIYDLIAVDMHYGGLGGGHYTAYAQNFIDKTWYEYNDNSVSMKSSTKQVVTAAAYLLFYRRREDHPLGGPILTEILEAAHTTADSGEPQTTGLREPSPHSGEGRRLGDSSRNGSSSAFRVGQAHRVGDGGSAITKIMTARGTAGALLEDGSPLRSVEMTGNNDEDLPPYSAASPGGLFSRNMGEGYEHDEGIDTSMDNAPVYGPQVSWNGGGWSFESIKHLTAAPRGSPDPDAPEEDLFQDSASTRVEGGDDSWQGSDAEIDSNVHDLVESFNGPGRGMRESAPPPDGMDVDDKIPTFVVPAHTLGDGDEDEDLEVHELLPPGLA